MSGSGLGNPGMLQMGFWEVSVVCMLQVKIRIEIALHILGYYYRFEWRTYPWEQTAANTEQNQMGENLENLENLEK